MAGGDPTWCSGHYEPSPGEAFHQHTLAWAWGSGDEKVRVGMSRFDSSGGAGAGRVEIIADVEGPITLDADEARTFAGNVLLAAAMTKRASTWRLALFVGCFYESARAFVAAVRSSRTASPRTASSHS